MAFVLSVLNVRDRKNFAVKKFDWNPRKFTPVNISPFMVSHIVYCKSFEVEKFLDFYRSIGNCKTSSDKACAIGFGHTPTVDVFQ